MRILLISQWFDPEPTIKGLDFAIRLQKLGHEVDVLTGYPNYPGGKLYPGYAIRPWSRETIDGVRITRVALFPSHSRSKPGRVANYLSFALASMLAAFFVRRPDVTYVYHPPGSAVLAAMALRLLRRVPFVIDVQDLWPETLSVTQMLSGRYALRLVDAWMRAAYRRASEVVVLSNGFRTSLLMRGVPDSKITVISNWAFAAPPVAAAPETPAASLDRRGPDGRFTIVFAGTMGLAQALDTVLDSARLLEAELPNVRFQFVGGGIDVGHLQALAADLGNVEFLPRRTPGEMSAVYQHADALLVHLRNDPLFEITIPSKTQAYLQAGRPILIGVKGDAAAMVETAGAGLAFEPQDAQSLVRAVRALVVLTNEERARMGAAGKAYYAQVLSPERGVDRWNEVLVRAASQICAAGGLPYPRDVRDRQEAAP
jgi:glycosyltransferase involved in cell wall biosynthesis